MVTANGSVPTHVRTEMAHTHVHWVADAVDVRLLHIKGAALHLSLRWPGRSGSDADILVRASEADALLHAMEKTGWTMAATFQHGSAFEHAATLRHTEYGWADIHRLFPRAWRRPRSDLRPVVVRT